MQRVLSRADVITVPSEFMFNNLESRGVKSIIIPNIINFNDYKFKFRDEFKPKLLWMRTYHPVYNPIMAIKTIEILKDKGISVNLIMAGFDSGYKKEVEDYIKENKLEEYVTVKGVILGNEKQEVADNCDIYLNTNNIDNTPVSLIEMGAMGLPIITTDVGGIKYMYKNEVNAFLVKENDFVSMANYVELIINNSEKTKSIVKNSYEYSRLYDSENVLKKWEDLINNFNKQ
ncbi:MAG: glycosyltransferase [Ignavibacteria bacterium]|nr:glycosyltransferase [Ignavibacteria bacterium]